MTLTDDILARVPEQTKTVLANATEPNQGGKFILVVGKPNSGRFIFSQSLSQSRPIMNLNAFHIPSLSTVDSMARKINQWLDGNNAVQFRALGHVSFSLDALTELAKCVSVPMIAYVETLSQVEVVDQELITNTIVLPFADTLDPETVDKNLYTSIIREKKEATVLWSSLVDLTYQVPEIKLDKAFGNFKIIKPKPNKRA